MSYEAKLTALGYTVDVGELSSGRFMRAVRTGNLVYTAGAVSAWAGEEIKGKLGQDLTIEDGYKAARLATLAGLKAIKSLTGSLDTVVRVVKQRRGVILSFLLRAKQLCNHPSQSLGDGVYAPEDSGKFARLRELCEPIASRQERVLVFTQFRELTEPLAEFLRCIFGQPGLVLHGETPVKQRQQLVQAFQSELGPPFFVLSLKAGGTGLNLTAASHVIHFDRWWNPAVESQASDRAYRIGQKKNVLIHKFVCRGTLEERIDSLIAAKQELSHELLSGGGEALLTGLQDDELLRLVSLDIRSALTES